MKFFSFNFIVVVVVVVVVFWFCFFRFLKLYSGHYPQFKSTMKLLEHGYIHLRCPLGQGKERVLRSYFKYFKMKVESSVQYTMWCIIL